MTAYISQLSKGLAQVQSPVPRITLTQRLSEWHASLPAVSRNRALSVSEIEKAIKSQGRYIGRELLCLGWQRRRVWSTGGSYNRYWVLPSCRSGSWP